MWEPNQPKSESPGTNIPGASTESQRINSAAFALLDPAKSPNFADSRSPVPVTAEEGDVPGGFWATLTHPRCDAALRDRAREEIHMLSHQIGAGQRADLKRLAEALAGLKRLRLEMEEQQRRARHTIEERERRIAELGSALNASERQRHESLTELQRLRQRMNALGGTTVFDQLTKLEERTRTAEQRQQALQAELAESRQACTTAREQTTVLEAECQGWQTECAAFEQLLAQSGRSPCNTANAHAGCDEAQPNRSA
jgi:chromosome segregation ATPase